MAEKSKSLFFPIIMLTNAIKTRARVTTPILKDLSIFDFDVIVFMVYNGLDYELFHCSLRSEWWEKSFRIFQAAKSNHLKIEKFKDGSEVTLNYGPC